MSADPNITSITASNGPVVVSASTFLADQSTLDKIVDGFVISDTAANLSANLGQLNDPNIDAITISDDGQVSASVQQLTSDATAIGILQDASASPVLLAINDSAANVEAGLSTLVADTGEITSITASNGPVVVSASTFLADQSTLDKIVGGFVISDTAAYVVQNLNALSADPNITSITASNGPVVVSASTFLADQSTLDKIVDGFVISDTAVNLSANLGQLNDPNIDAITISDNGQIGASVQQLTTDATAIGKLQNAGGGAYQLAVVDSASNVLAGLSILEADVARIASITATGGTVTVATAIFLADQNALDKIFGGFDVSDTAANVVAKLPNLDADSHVAAVTVISGSATLSGGGAVNVANLAETGSGTSLTVSEKLGYAGAFTQGAGSKLSISSADTLSLSGTASGTTSGAGTLALAGGSEFDQQRRHYIGRKLVDLRFGHERDPGREPELRGRVQRGGGRHLCPVGRPSPFDRRRHVLGRDGGRLEVA